MQTKLSIWSGYYGECPIEGAVEEFIKDGIYASELSTEHGQELVDRDPDVVKTGKALRAFLEKKSFDMSQGHLWLRSNICSCPEAVDILCRWIDLYEAIGIKNMVLHCDMLEGSGLTKTERLAQNLARIRLLAAHVEGKDVTICLENLRPENEDDPEARPVQGVDDLLYLIERLGSDRFGICLDTGHLNLTDKDQKAFIRKAGKRLKALHIANNDGLKDHHIMPFGRGNVNFFHVVEALREVDYHGLFNLEIGGEGGIPLFLRHEKAKFIKSGYEYLMKG